MQLDQLMKILDRISEINGLELKVSVDSDNNSIKVLHISTEHIKFVEYCDSVDKEMKPVSPIYHGVGDLGEWWKNGPTCEQSTVTSPESIDVVECSSTTDDSMATIPGYTTMSNATITTQDTSYNYSTSTPTICIEGHSTR